MDRWMIAAGLFAVAGAIAFAPGARQAYAANAPVAKCSIAEGPKVITQGNKKEWLEGIEAAIQGHLNEGRQRFHIEGAFVCAW